MRRFVSHSSRLWWNRLRKFCSLITMLEASGGLRNWNQRIYFRIFVAIFGTSETRSATSERWWYARTQDSHACLPSLRPSRVGVFAFAWLELISHEVSCRNFCLPSPLLPLTSPHPRGLVHAETSACGPVRNYGTVSWGSERVETRDSWAVNVRFACFSYSSRLSRVFVWLSLCVLWRDSVLLHSTSKSHSVRIFHVPMRLPDPFTPDLKVDLLPNLASTSYSLRFHECVAHTEMWNRILICTFRVETQRCSPSWHKSLRLPSSRYNIRVMNALVLYVGTKNNRTRAEEQQLHDELTFHVHL